MLRTVNAKRHKEVNLQEKQPKLESYPKKQFLQLSTQSFKLQNTTSLHFNTS